MPPSASFALRNFRGTSPNTRAHSFTKTTPIIVEATVETAQGNRNAVGEVEPRAIRMPITVDGISCNDVAEITTSIIIFVVAYGVFLSIEQIAPMPMGVAAFPSPRRLADMFIAIYRSVSGDSPRNSRFITGRRARATSLDAPVFSSSAKKPSQNP